jgi:NAD(P)-dependent dehydrogenase (short-subunit alcohol dehydrogenase family)
MNSDHLGRNAMANSKDVVVTGVSTGIGWGTTKVLVSKGFRVFGSVRKQADADRLQREFGNGFVPLTMDVTDANAVHQAAQKVGSMTGDRNLVGLVNNAGIVVSGPLLYLRPSEYKAAVGCQHNLPACRNPSLRSSFGNGIRRGTVPPAAS